MSQANNWDDMPDFEPGLSAPDLKAIEDTLRHDRQTLLDEARIRAAMRKVDSAIPDVLKIARSPSQRRVFLLALRLASPETARYFRDKLLSVIEEAEAVRDEYVSERAFARETAYHEEKKRGAQRFEDEYKRCSAEIVSYCSQKDFEIMCERRALDAKRKELQAREESLSAPNASTLRLVKDLLKTFGYDDASVPAPSAVMAHVATIVAAKLGGMEQAEERDK